MQIALLSNGKVTDKVDSYAAMRKYSTRRDKDGIVRLQLNNEDVFQFGPLDQGLVARRTVYSSDRRSVGL